MDHFEDANLRIVRSMEKLEAIDQEITHWMHEHMPSLVMDPTTNGGLMLKVKFDHDLPKIWRVRLTEIAEGLRAGLDLTGFAVALKTGGQRTKTKFPFAEDASQLESQIKSASSHLPSEVISIFRGCNPFKDGNYELWAMNKICNQGKHGQIKPIFRNISDIQSTIVPKAGKVDITLKPLVKPLWDEGN
ncbi:hypothetical protein [Lichenifustis flavocetrariae]|uniref:Uncharacterized protein n=1 Tax=Lichenifustis flavocetrariae TaxID=2949735 RepID=A0AA41Z4G7_9HYPH|nr:hypothetical protein [Lichenifustis flavocetrariae]MCW6512630.1 hypothetical protein [Lichenifustis flavocetrariae]